MSYYLLFIENTEFHSILVDWGEACCDSPIVASLSTTLMVGALVGAFVAGWIADAYGRRPVVTNLVLLVECLEQPRSRLLAVSLNGWSFSMVCRSNFLVFIICYSFYILSKFLLECSSSASQIFVAVLARSSLHWFFFHLYTAIAALSSSVAFVGLPNKSWFLNKYPICFIHTLLNLQYVWTVESCRWLASVQRISESRSAAIFVAKINRSTVTSDALWWEIVGFSAPILSSTVEPKSEMSKRYRYIDLFRIIGIIPFIVSNCVGRRPIVLFSVGIACLGAWLATFSQFSGTSSTHWSLAVLSLIVASSLDPTWKINHLYSAELFPTVIRNMARGICNVGARLGSVAAPSVSIVSYSPLCHLRSKSKIGNTCRQLV
uniref:MFS domain-containing protein n=1 Tax=Heterorhabditis bacteriophora TaxID=37862 RepID=A0A1I7WIM9_HETBA